MGFLKFVAIVLLGYVVLTALAVCNAKVDWILTVKNALAFIKWGQQFGFFEVGAAILGVAFVLL